MLGCFVGTTGRDFFGLGIQLKYLNSCSKVTSARLLWWAESVTSYLQSEMSSSRLFKSKQESVVSQFGFPGNSSPNQLRHFIIYYVQHSNIYICL